MDAVELPLPAAIVTKLMRSSGCGGGSGVTRVELLASQTEGETWSSSFKPQKGNSCNVNVSRPAFWNKISDVDLHRQASQLSRLGSQEAPIDHDRGNKQSSFDISISQAKQSQRKSTKTTRSNGNSSRRSRVAHMETSLNAAGPVDINGSPNELGSQHGTCEISVTEKMQTAKQKNVSVKRSEKRNGKVPKSRYDSFSVRAGLSSFSSAAGGNYIFGVYGSEQDICDVTKHMEELSLNELLDGSYKCPLSDKDKGKKMGNLNANMLDSIREACAILQLQKPTQPQNLPAVDTTCRLNASSSRCDDNKGDMVDLSSCNKVEDRPNILEFPLFAPKDVMDRLVLSPPKDLDRLLLDNTKPTSTSKGNLDQRLGKPVHSRGGLPTFPWSHISGGHFRTNLDGVKLAPNKSTCQGRWVKIGNSVTSFGDTTTFLADFESLGYDQSLVPLGCQQPGLTEKEKSPLPSVIDMTFERGQTPSGAHMIASNIADGHSAGVLAAAETLCEIAAHFQRQDQNAIIKWPKKPTQKSMRATKLKSDEQLEKALFTIPSSTPMEPTNLTNTSKRLDKPETKHHDSGPMKRPFITAAPTRLSDKPTKVRKLMPMSLTDKRRSAFDGKH